MSALVPQVMSLRDMDGDKNISYNPSLYCGIPIRAMIRDVVLQMNWKCDDEALWKISSLRASPKNRYKSYLFRPELNIGIGE